PDKSAAFFSWSQNTHSGYFCETLGCVASKMRVMLKNCWASDTLDVINRSREANRACKIWRAGFKSMRRFLKRALFQSDTHDHLTAAMPWRHRIEDLG